MGEHFILIGDDLVCSLKSVICGTVQSAEDPGISTLIEVAFSSSKNCWLRSLLVSSKKSSLKKSSLKY